MYSVIRGNMSVIVGVILKGLNILEGIICLAAIALILYFEASFVYGFVMGAPSTISALMLLIIMVFIFYIVDLVVFAVLIALAYIFLGA